MQELQTEFDKLDLTGADKPRQTRFLRSQQTARQKQEQTTASGGGATASAMVDEMEVDGEHFHFRSSSIGRLVYFQHRRSLIHWKCWNRPIFLNVFRRTFSRRL